MVIGITESNDASIDFSWVEKLDTVDAAIIITKNLTDKVIEELINNKEKLILHATCTGWGGSILESNIPEYTKQLEQVKKLISLGFPKEQIVIRIDPIIPTKEGLEYVENVIKYISSIVTRFRISVLDMYPHVRDRFKAIGFKDPYNGYFQASNKTFDEVNVFLKDMITKYSITVEGCAEDKLPDVELTGCVSIKDIIILGLEQSKLNTEVKYPLPKFTS